MKRPGAYQPLYNYNGYQDTEMFLGKLGKWVDKNVGGFHKDITQGIVGVAVAPVNSITGHRYTPTYSTKVGGAISSGANIGVDSVHIAGKTFANAISGGLASKITDVARDKDHKEAGGRFNEFKSTSGANNLGITQKLQGVSKGGAVVIGQLYGSKAGGSSGSSSSKPSPGATPSDTQPAAIPTNDLASMLPDGVVLSSDSPSPVAPAEEHRFSIVDRFSIFD